jgi:hypothetical protein
MKIDTGCESEKVAGKWLYATYFLWYISGQAQGKLFALNFTPIPNHG